MDPNTGNPQQPQTPSGPPPSQPPLRPQPSQPYQGQPPAGQGVPPSYGPGPGAAPRPAYQMPPAYGMPPAAPMPVQPAPKSRAWIVGVVIAVCILIFGIFCVQSCSNALFSLGGSSLSSEPAAPDSVAVIDLDGTIQYDGTACSPEGLASLLQQAEDDNHIKAVVLRVNSGGGTATAGEEMTQLVREFSKPIVVSSASINASAAYEISSQADYIYVAKSTEIGAIGTAMQISDYSGLMDMLGISVDVITSADSKDSSYGFRPLSEEEREYYQRMVDQINATFIESVAEGRSMTVDEVRALATGLPFTGLDAVENGLADEVGTREDALAKAAELAGLDSYREYTLSLSRNLTDWQDLL